MPKVKISGLPTEEPDINATGGNFYDGETPPAATYKCVLKFIKLKTNRNGDAMLSILVEINEPKKVDGEKNKKSKYNGYGMWGNINLTESGAPYAARMCKAIGAKYSDLLNSLTVNDEDPPQILRIGKTKITGEQKVTVEGRPNVYDGKTSLQIGRFVVKDNDDADSDADDDEDEDAPF